MYKPRVIDKQLPKEWIEKLDKGWTIWATSCMCGGNWAWFKPSPRNNGTMVCIGCVCHTNLKEYK